jgi:hypothetical protein
MRFRLILDRGATPNTRTPDILFVKFVYLPKMKPRWGFDVDLNLYREYKGRSPFQQMADIRTASENVELVEFTFRDDETTGDPRNYYVKVETVEAVEETGYDERGLVRVRMIEP